MNIPKKQLKKKINQNLKEVKSLTEKKEETNPILLEKRKEFNNLREKIYSKLNKNEEDEKQLYNNQDLIDLINKEYESVISFNKNKKNIEYNLDKLKNKVQKKGKKLEEPINKFQELIDEEENKISRINHEINEYIRDQKIEFDQLNYILNPAHDFVDVISQLELEKIIYNNMKNQIEKTKKLNEEEPKEIQKLKNKLLKLKEKNGIKDEIKEKVSSQDLKNDFKTSSNMNDTLVWDDIEFDSDSIVLELTKRYLDNFIESPRFIDKIITKENIPKIKPVKLKFESFQSDTLATPIRIKHVIKPKENLNDLTKELNDGNKKIKDLNKEIEDLNKIMKESKNKINKVKESIEFADIKIQILKDQIKILNEETEQLKNNNNGNYDIGIPNGMYRFTNENDYQEEIEENEEEDNLPTGRVKNENDKKENENNNENEENENDKKENENNNINENEENENYSENDNNDNNDNNENNENE